MDVARQIMENSCKEFFVSLERPEKRGFLGRPRKSVDAQLAQRLKQNGACDIQDVINLVNDLESEWKNKHGMVLLPDAFHDSYY
jgi:hypothetical protein